MSRGNSRPTATTYVGATARPILIYAKDEDGTAYDLSGFVSATLSARNRGPDGTVIIDAATMTIDTGDNSVTYTPTSGELATSGPMDAQVMLTDASANVEFLEPFILDIQAPITGS